LLNRESTVDNEEDPEVVSTLQRLQQDQTMTDQESQLLFLKDCLTYQVNAAKIHPQKNVYLVTF
jgi:hypothetical protein